MGGLLLQPGLHLAARHVSFTRFTRQRVVACDQSLIAIAEAGQPWRTKPAPIASVLRTYVERG